MDFYGGGGAGFSEGEGADLVHSFFAGAGTEEGLDLDGRELGGGGEEEERRRRVRIYTR